MKPYFSRSNECKCTRIFISQSREECVRTLPTNEQTMFPHTAGEETRGRGCRIPVATHCRVVDEIGKSLTLAIDDRLCVNKVPSHSSLEVVFWIRGGIRLNRNHCRRRAGTTFTEPPKISDGRKNDAATWRRGTPGFQSKALDFATVTYASACRPPWCRSRLRSATDRSFALVCAGGEEGKKAWKRWGYLLL